MNFLKALLDATKNSSVTHIKVLRIIILNHLLDYSELLCLQVQCPDPSQTEPGEACRVLADHRAAVRVGGVVKGLTTPTKGYESEPAFVSDVLK